MPVHPKLAICLSLALALALVTAGGAVAKTYFGVVGPGQTITFKNAKGKTVSRIKTGTHTIKIDDRSSFHNFHLIGTGVNKKTGVPFVGHKTWTPTFSAGRYRYRCDSHKLLMKGS